VSKSSDGLPKPLTACPQCRYDLTGLPRTHTCPECGFEYDESMRAWAYKGPRFADHVLNGAFVLVFVVPSWVFVLGVACTTKSLLWAGIVTVGSALLLASCYVRSCLVASDTGVILCGRKRRYARYPWTSIWIPHPDKRLSLSPWAHETNQELSHGTSRLRRLLFRELPIPIGKLRTAFFLRERPRWGLNGGCRHLTVIASLPRQARRVAMLYLYERWRAAIAVQSESNAQRSGTST